MPFLPSGPFGVAALLVILIGLFALTRRGIPKAYALGVIMLLVFAVEVLSGVLKRPEAVGYELGFQVDTLFSGKWWSPLTALFVHADLLHLFGNLFILLTAGPALEDRIGERKFLVVFFVAGFAGWAAHTGLAYVIPSIVGVGQTALGASGAIFGVLTTFAVRYPRTPLPILFGFFVLFFPAFVVLLIYLAFNLTYLVSDAYGAATGIAWWGHFAGFLVGLPFAYTLPKTAPGDVQSGTKGLPDPERLAHLATTPQLTRLLDKVRQFTPDARTANDSQFALAWVDQFLAKARCPACGEPFERSGLRATCKRGETTVEFARQ